MSNHRIESLPSDATGMEAESIGQGTHFFDGWSAHIVVGPNQTPEQRAALDEIADRRALDLEPDYTDLMFSSGSINPTTNGE